MIQKLFSLFSVINPQSTILLGLITIFSPLIPTFYGVLFLIFADTITGIMASYKRDKVEFKFFSWKSWNHITSEKLGRTINKSLVYMLVILSAFTIGTIILGIPDMYVTKFFVSVICLREIKSLIENGEMIMGGGFIQDIKVFGRLGFKGGLENLFDDTPKESPIKEVNVKLVETPEDKPDKIEVEIKHENPDDDDKPNN